MEEIKKEEERTKETKKELKKKRKKEKERKRTEQRLPISPAITVCKTLDTRNNTPKAIHFTLFAIDHRRFEQHSKKSPRETLQFVSTKSVRSPQFFTSQYNSLCIIIFLCSDSPRGTNHFRSQSDGDRRIHTSKGSSLNFADRRPLRWTVVCCQLVAIAAGGHSWQVLWSARAGLARWRGVSSQREEPKIARPFPSLSRCTLDGN